MRLSAMRGFRAERYQASARARSRGAGKQSPADHLAGGPMRSSAMRGFRAERYQASARARSRGAGKDGMSSRSRRFSAGGRPAVSNDIR